ncbi:MAG: hypothetical protein V3W41_11080 [Planctomycetota bacterium]
MGEARRSKPFHRDGREERRASPEAPVEASEVVIVKTAPGPSSGFPAKPEAYSPKTLYARVVNSKGEIQGHADSKVSVDLYSKTDSPQLLWCSSWRADDQAPSGLFSARMSPDFWRAAGFAKNPTKPRYFWQVHGLFREHLIFEADVDSRAESPQLLKLPPCGWVEVELRDPKGKLLQEEVRLRSHIQKKDLYLESFSYDHSGHRSQHTKLRDVKGRALIGPVALACRIRVQVEVPRGSSVESRSFVIEGPQQDGERVQRTLAWSKEARFLLARVVDEAGEAVSNQKFFLSATVRRVVKVSHVQSGRSDSWQQTLTTDSQGRIKVRIAMSVPSSVRAILDVFLLRLQGANVAGEYRVARSRLELQPHQPEVQLGKLVLLEPPFLVRGRVIDDLGNPVGGAETKIHEDLKGDSDFGLKDYAGGQWFGHGMSNQDGCFSYYYWVDDAGKALRMSASKDGHLDGLSDQFIFGDSGIVIVLGRDPALQEAVK